MWPLSFISEDDFKRHVRDTIINYQSKLVDYNLTQFNSNNIDPIKLLFDKYVYDFGWDEVVKSEIARQLDKSTNNDIGYFHQNIFKYIADCSVPSSGWDVIYEPSGGANLPDGQHVKRLFVEMKNKHNTMNSSASSKTYQKMQRQLLSDGHCACLLVEIIARNSQDITWKLSVDGKKEDHPRIRRVSIDQFYAIVTGQADAFHQMCKVLPQVIRQELAATSAETKTDDTVISEIYEIMKKEGITFEDVLYRLGFPSYTGF